MKINKILLLVILSVASLAHAQKQEISDQLVPAEKYPYTPYSAENLGRALERAEVTQGQIIAVLFAFGGDEKVKAYALPQELVILILEQLGICLHKNLYDGFLNLIIPKDISPEVYKLMPRAGFFIDVKNNLFSHQI